MRARLNCAATLVVVALALTGCGAVEQMGEFGECYDGECEVVVDEGARIPLEPGHHPVGADELDYEAIVIGAFTPGDSLGDAMVMVGRWVDGEPTSDSKIYPAVFIDQPITAYNVDLTMSPNEDGEMVLVLSGFVDE